MRFPRLIVLVVVVALVHTRQAIALNHVEGQRVVNLCTVCLPDVKEHHNRPYVLSMIRRAARTGANDLIVVPFTPFLSFMEGRESTDLSDFTAAARAGPA